VPDITTNPEGRYAPPCHDLVYRRFEQFGFPVVIDSNIIPDDDTTLFICSGMQRVKHRFLNPDGSKHGSLQSCVRTNDLELVGDGQHLTYFEMLGNFSFGGNDYQSSVELWHCLLSDLSIKVDSVHVHPDRPDHRELWTGRGYTVVPDSECVWSDGTIGGHCCEVYSRGLEIGNLVNTLGHSTDVGFGWERLHLILENKQNIHDTSLFQHHHPVVADHVRTLEVMRKNGIKPGCKGREFVCQRLLRRMLKYLDGSEKFIFGDWIEEQREKRRVTLDRARRMCKRHHDKSPDWWYSTCGLLPEEMEFLRD